MNSLNTTNFRNHFFAIICTILFSSTVLLSATAPALAGEPGTATCETASVAAPLA